MRNDTHGFRIRNDFRIVRLEAASIWEEVELGTLRINSFGTFSTNDTNDQEFPAFPGIGVMRYQNSAFVSLLNLASGFRKSF